MESGVSEYEKPCSIQEIVIPDVPRNPGGFCGLPKGRKRASRFHDKSRITEDVRVGFVFLCCVEKTDGLAGHSEKRGALRYQLARLLQERSEAEGRVITWREVSEATGVSVPVVSSLASPRGSPPTNTRFLESVCRYFRVTPGETLELYPSLDEEPRCRVDELYPEGRMPAPTSKKRRDPDGA